MTNTKRRKLRVVLLSLPLIALIVVLTYTTRVHPVEVEVASDSALSTTLLRCLGSEMQKHPYAVAVSVTAQMRDKHTKLLRYDRRTRTLSYDSGGARWHHEWNYREVNETAAFYIAQNAAIQRDSSLSLSSETLSKYGCKLTSFSLVPTLRDLD